ncbi:MAG: PIG-L family deacetylase [Chthoniobacter sp.]|nr:PIG-L family deacetylase [Chthoniobacter sp.]
MKVLVISVHPDDETLGCGGTMLKHAAAGDEIFWLIATQAHEPAWDRATIAAKAVEVERVARAYGVSEFQKLGLPSGQLDAQPLSQMIDSIREVVAKVRPAVVYLVHAGDIHTDHYAIFTAAMSVLKPFYMNKQGVHRVLSYETLSSTEAAPAQLHRLFAPNAFNDVSPYLERKIEIMNLYATELHADPLPRGPSAIRALARFRGATIAVEYAEAFMLVREIL